LLFRFCIKKSISSVSVYGVLGPYDELWILVG
jgi:hypothetical protein